MARAQSSLVAYMKDGTAVGFTHAVDYNEAISRGYSVNPPGVPAKEKMPAPEGEAVSGVHSLAKAEVVTDEKLVPLAEAEAADKTSKIRRR